LANANGSPNQLKDLNIKKWRLLKSDEQENIRAIENIGTPIGKLFDIWVGIATLKDEIYFIDGANKKGNCYVKETERGFFEIEETVTQPVYKISDFKNQSEVEQNARRIICPYYIKNGVATAIPENEFKKKFPKCYAYFLTEKENLLARDKGKVIFDPFFVWGRTQGLKRTGKKILSPTFSQRPRFLVVNEEQGFFTNGYGIYFKELKASNSLFQEDINPLAKLENIEVVQKILNSYIMHYYVSKTSISIEGGYPCYQKNFIEKFTIPFLSNDEIKLLRKMDDAEQIDDFLLGKYQMNLPAPNLCV